MGDGSPHDTTRHYTGLGFEESSPGTMYNPFLLDLVFTFVATRTTGQPTSSTPTYICTYVPPTVLLPRPRICCPSPSLSFLLPTTLPRVSCGARTMLTSGAHDQAPELADGTTTTATAPLSSTLRSVCFVQGSPTLHTSSKLACPG